jgi:hypothetical protein
LSTKRPSRAFNGPPHFGQTSCPSCGVGAASTRTTLYSAPHVGHANGVGSFVGKMISGSFAARAFSNRYSMTQTKKMTVEIAATVALNSLC